MKKDNGLNDFKEKMKSWTDDGLETSYLNAIRIVADGQNGKATPEKLAAAKKHIAAIEIEWDRRRLLAANKRYNPERPRRGMLQRLRYHVGNEGVDTAKRRIILERAVNGMLPFVPHPAYMDEWGEPGTPQRLAKLVRTIARLVQKNKGYNNDSYAKAIIEWEEDLAWLRQKFYDTARPRHDFKWPKT